MKTKNKFLPKKLGLPEVLGVGFFVIALVAIPLVLKAISSPVYQNAEALSAKDTVECQRKCVASGYAVRYTGEPGACPVQVPLRSFTNCCCNYRVKPTSTVKQPTPTPNPATLPDLTFDTANTVNPVKLVCHEGYICYADGQCNYNGTYSIDRVVATVTNLGKGTAKNVPIAYWANDQYVGRRTIDWFTPAGSANWTTQKIFISPLDINQEVLKCHQNADGSWDTKTVKVCVNLSLEQMSAVIKNKAQRASYKQVLESNYNNNCKTVSLSCNPQVCCEKGCTPSCCDPAKGL